MGIAPAPGAFLPRGGFAIYFLHRLGRVRRARDWTANSSFKISREARCISLKDHRRCIQARTWRVGGAYIMISSLFLLVQKPLVRKVARKYPRASREPMPTADDDADFIFPGGTAPKGPLRYAIYRSVYWHITPKAHGFSFTKWSNLVDVL